MAALFTLNGKRNRIIRHKCPDKKRAIFLPRFVGNKYQLYENAIYDFLGQVSPGYNGGYWEFYSLSNGGFYMSLSKKGFLEIEQPSNNYKGTMSADAASIAANLYILGHFAITVHEKWFSRSFHRLRDYAIQHPEASEILRLID